MDANITDRTYNILERMRGIEGVLYHRNEYQNATEDKYYITGNKELWLGLLYKSIEEKVKVAVPISSLTEANTICDTIKKQYPNVKINIYSSRTKCSEKKEHHEK